MSNNKSCRKASRLASDAYERRLSLGERFRMRLHILMCQSCRNCEHEIHLLHDVLALIRKRHGSLDAELSLKDREVIRNALRDLNHDTSRPALPEK